MQLLKRALLLDGGGRRGPDRRQRGWRCPYHPLWMGGPSRALLLVRMCWLWRLGRLGGLEMLESPLQCWPKHVIHWACCWHVSKLKVSVYSWLLGWRRLVEPLVCGCVLGRCDAQCVWSLGPSLPLCGAGAGGGRGYGLPELCWQWVVLCARVPWEFAWALPFGADDAALALVAPRAKAKLVEVKSRGG